MVDHLSDQRESVFLRFWEEDYLSGEVPLYPEEVVSGVDVRGGGTPRDVDEVGRPEKVMWSRCYRRRIRS